MLKLLVIMATLALLSACDAKNGAPPNAVNTNASTKTTTPREIQAVSVTQSQSQLRIEICDHLAGELNGVPAEDIKITQDMKDERCSEHNADIANTSDLVTDARIHSSSHRLTPKIRKLTKKADNYFFVSHKGFSEKDQLLLVLVIQTPSRQNRSDGACGAGTEDTAYILKYNKRTNYLDPIDSLLIQSCLHSFSINNDSGSTLRSVLDKNINKDGFTVDWLNHPKFGTGGKDIVIKHGKFAIN